MTAIAILAVTASRKHDMLITRYPLNGNWNDLLPCNCVNTSDRPHSNNQSLAHTQVKAASGRSLVNHRELYIWKYLLSCPTKDYPAIPIEVTGVGRRRKAAGPSCSQHRMCPPPQPICGQPHRVPVQNFEISTTKPWNLTARQ